MDVVQDSRLTRTRVVALVLVALLAVGHVGLRVSRDADRVTVPSRASAGDLSLEPCHVRTGNGSYRGDCGTLVVAENDRDPRSRLIALPVLRVRALTDHPQEPVFFLTGGPGASNIEFASALADRYIAHRDFVVVGYRGADGSVRLDCPEVSRALSSSADILSDSSFDAAADAYRSCAGRLAHEGIDVTRYGLVQQVDDMETARAALGYDRIDLLSESAGTRTALIYAWRHPDSINRSVMVGVNPPGGFLWDPALTDEQLRRFADLCRADAVCRARTDDLVTTMRRTDADLPRRWLFLPVKRSNVRVATLFGMFETAPTGAASAPTMIDSWLAAAHGDSSGLWFTSVLADVVFADAFIAGQRAAAASIDYPAAREYFADGPGDLSDLGRAATASAWAAGRWIDVWPAAADVQAYQQVRPTSVDTLVVNGELDVSTPPQLADRELMPSLLHGQQVVLPGFGHTGSFFHQQPEAGTHLVETYLDTGTVDVSRYHGEALDFTPPTTFGDRARTLLATLGALAAVTVVLLLLPARRVRTRGRVGPVTAVALRSLVPVVTGAGGWSVGALLVLSAFPAVRITDGLLVVVSVAVPIALGMYHGWVHADWPAPDKRVGGAAALAGALVGAWLGSSAATVPFAVLTAIAGSIGGGNLALLLVDTTGAAARVPADAVRPLPDERPSPPAPVGIP